MAKSEFDSWFTSYLLHKTASCLDRDILRWAKPVLEMGFNMQDEMRNENKNGGLEFKGSQSILDTHTGILAGLKSMREDIQSEIVRRAGHPNLGKIGCIKRIDKLLVSIENKHIHDDIVTGLETKIATGKFNTRRLLHIIENSVYDMSKPESETNYMSLGDYISDRDSDVKTAENWLK